MHPPPVALKQSLLPFKLTTTKPSPQPAQSTIQPLIAQPVILAADQSQSQPASAPETAPDLAALADAPTSTQPQSPAADSPAPQPHSEPSTSTAPPQPAPPPADASSTDPAPTEPPPRRLGPGGVAILPPAPPYNVCAYCMNPATKNKFGKKEAMVSCYECGSSGHPSCCGFDDARMVRNVRSYNWCCGDCTRCEVCDVKGEDNDETVSWTYRGGNGSAERASEGADGCVSCMQDDTLLCDTCDRGWHQSCLTPPMVDVPDGKHSPRPRSFSFPLNRTCFMSSWNGWALCRCR